MAADNRTAHDMGEMPDGSALANAAVVVDEGTGVDVIVHFKYFYEEGLDALEGLESFGGL